MKTAPEKIAPESPVCRIREDGLSTEELADLVSRSGVWEPAGPVRLKTLIVHRTRRHNQPLIDSMSKR